MMLLNVSGKQLKSNNKDCILLFEYAFHSCFVVLDSFTTLDLLLELQCKVWIIWKIKIQTSNLAMAGGMKRDSCPTLATRHIS